MVWIGRSLAKQNKLTDIHHIQIWTYNDSIKIKFHVFPAMIGLHCVAVYIFIYKQNIQPVFSTSSEKWKKSGKQWDTMANASLPKTEGHIPGQKWVKFEI